MRFLSTSFLAAAVLSLPLAASATTQNLSTGFATYFEIGAPAGAICMNMACSAVPVVGNPGWSATIPGATWVNFSGTSDYGADNPNGQYMFVTTFIASGGSTLSGSFSSDNNASLELLAFPIFDLGTLGQNIYGTSSANYSFNTVTNFSTVLPFSDLYALVATVDNGQSDPNLGDGPNVDGPYGLLVGATVTSPTPEPSSLVLLGTGVLGLAGAVRRRLGK